MAWAHPGRVRGRTVSLVECARQHLLTAPVADRAISLRRSCGISLPDAVIAATALESDSILVTRNVRDSSRDWRAAGVQPIR